MSRTFGDTRIYNNGAELKVRESNSCVSLTQFDIYLFKKAVVHILVKNNLRQKMIRARVSALLHHEFSERVHLF